MNAHIRELGAHELRPLTELRRSMVLELDGKDLDRTMPGWRERYVQFFSGYVATGTGAVWAIEEDGRSIALAAAYMPVNHRSQIALSRVLYICNVYVDPGWRRKGLAKALMVHAIEWARNKKCDVVRLRTSWMGRALYESMGFERSDELELFLT